jgi:hypothetical protein
MVGCVSIAIAAMGCGGGGAESDYAEQYSTVTAKVETQIGKLQSAPTTDPEKLGTELGTLADALGDAATEFAAIEPPDNAKAGHAKVQTGVETLAADLRKSAKALDGSSSPTATVEALGAIANSKGAAAIAAGEQELQQAGYETK